MRKTVKPVKYTTDSIKEKIKSSREKNKKSSGSSGAARTVKKRDGNYPVKIY